MTASPLTLLISSEVMVPLPSVSKRSLKRDCISITMLAPARSTSPSVTSPSPSRSRLGRLPLGRRPCGASSSASTNTVPLMRSKILATRSSTAASWTLRDSALVISPSPLRSYFSSKEVCFSAACSEAARMSSSAVMTPLPSRSCFSMKLATRLAAFSARTAWISSWVTSPLPSRSYRSRKRACRSSMFGAGSGA